MLNPCDFRFYWICLEEWCKFYFKMLIFKEHQKFYLVQRLNVWQNIVRYKLTNMKGSAGFCKVPLADMQEVRRPLQSSSSPAQWLGRGTPAKFQPRSPSLLSGTCHPPLSSSCDLDAQCLWSLLHRCTPTVHHNGRQQSCPKYWFSKLNKMSFVKGWE